MSPRRFARLRRTGFALGLFVMFVGGTITRPGHVGVVLVVSLAFLLFALFQTYLLWALNHLNDQLNVANAERNTAVAERDLAYASRDRVWAQAQGLVKTSEEVVSASQKIVRQQQERRGYIAGEPSVVQLIVAEARQRGVEVDYVPLDDLDGS